MKKIIPILLIAVLIFAGCSKTEEPGIPVSSETSAHSSPTTDLGGVRGDKSQDTATSAAASPYELTDAYVAGMDGYEDLEVMYLGTAEGNRTTDDILARAFAMEGFGLLTEIDADHIIVGETDEYINNVYLFIPGDGVDVKIGKYSWYAAEITEVWFSEENAKPFIYIESGNSMDPLGEIDYTRHVSDGSYDGFMYTGLNFVTVQLRTEYHMGIVDITDYTMFDPGELQWYGQSFLDSISSVYEVSKKLGSGYTLTYMDEMIYDGHTYAIFSLNTPGGSGEALYAIHADLDTGARTMIMSDTGATWTQIGVG